MARKRRETTDTDTRHYTDYPTGADFLFLKKQEKSASKPLDLLVSTVFRSPFLKRKFEKNVPVGLVGMWVCGPGRRSEAKP